MNHRLVCVVSIEVHDHNQRVRLAGTGQFGRRVACESQNIRVGRRQHGEVVVAQRGRVGATNLVERGEHLGHAVLLGLAPIANLDLVLLVVDLLFEAGALLVLDEFVTVVDTPGRRAHGCQHRTHAVAGYAVVSHVSGENIRRGGPEGVVLVVAVVAIGDRQILFQFVLGVAPREVAVGLGEAHVAQGAHHAWAGECLGQEQDLRVLLGHGGNHVLPETHRLGVRIIDPEDRHARLDPQVHDALDFLFDARHVGVEVDRIYILIFLRRVFGERDGAVRLVPEPVRMSLDPRVIGRALQGEIERYLQSEFVRTPA